MDDIVKRAQLMPTVNTFLRGLRSADPEAAEGGGPTHPSFVYSTLVPLLLLAACGAGQPAVRPDAGAAPVPSTVPSAVPSTGPTTTAPAAIEGCPTGIGAAAQDADQAVRCLYAAWREDSRANAALFASQDVVDSLFTTRWSPPAGSLRPCRDDPAIGAQTCSIDYHGAEYLFDARRSEGGWRVTQLRGPRQP